MIIPYDYTSLWDAMKITDEKAVSDQADKAIKNKARYQSVATATGLPWAVIACIHYRESGYSFLTHLHNGDPLTKRTTHDPKGRPLALPKSGKFPYTWEESAIDAIKMKVTDKINGLDGKEGWVLNEALYLFEIYNGLGYRKYHDMNSPYLWSYTQWYTKGKYAYDGVFSATLVDKQIGCAPLLAMIERKDAGWL